MKELAAILKACAGAPGQSLVLATLVKASGSTYRRPGARMLVLPGGAAIGSISGGCLERDVIEKSPAITETGRAALLTYDTTTEEDIVFGAGLGCKGAVHILLEPVRPDNSAGAFIRFAETLFKRRESGVAATVFHSRGTVSAQPGDRLMLDPDGKFAGQIKDETLAAKMADSLREALSSNRSRTVEYELSGGGSEVFVEMIHPPAPLVIFGAGYDAVPMARLAKEIGFHVTIVDPRPAYATAERFPDADAVVVARPEEAVGLDFNERTAAVIMSHNYLTDRAFLKALLPLPLRYLGLMGPRARAQKMLDELRAEGMAATLSGLEKIHNPVGLDIGAESPEQIALAILAEIQAVHSRRPGGSLREKKGPIHSQPAP